MRTNLEVVYNNKHYQVLVLEEPIVDPKGELLPMAYGLYNTRTNVMEAYSTYLPAAVQAVQGLSEKIDELMPEQENVIELNAR